jgi:hypothetical protein
LHGHTVWAEAQGGMLAPVRAVAATLQPALKKKTPCGGARPLEVRRVGLEGLIGRDGDAGNHKWREVLR